MKKLLLLALVAIFGVSVQAQNDPTVIKDQPAGTLTPTNVLAVRCLRTKKVRTVSRNFLCLTLQNWQKTVEPAGDLLMVTAADGKTVYLKNALTFGTYIDGDPFNAWIKGTKDGNVITIPAGQYIYYGELQNGSKAGIQVGYMELKDGQIQPIDDPIKFYVDGASIKLGETYMEGQTMDDLKLKMLGGYWSDEKSLFCGDLETVFTTDPNGIETVAAGANKQVVGETFFDLSGRKLSKAGKGVSIKSVKFADGTTKSVKYIGK